MNIKEYSEEVVRELDRTLSKISPESGERFADILLQAEKIFVAGAGRSGFMCKSFAMRLMHMGFDSYVVGETVTPNITADDVLVIGSGSGETASLVSMASKAKIIGAKIVLVTIFPQSTIGKLADVIVQIPAPTPKVAQKTEFISIQPMGSLFEQCLLLFLDSSIMRLMEKQGKDSRTMFGRHANLE